MYIKSGLLKEYASIFGYLVKIVDVLIILCSGYFSYWLVNLSWIQPDYNIKLILGNMLLAYIIFPHFNLYKSWRGETLFDEFRMIAIAWSIVWVILGAVGFVFKFISIYSRLWLGAYLIVGLLGLFLFRILLRIILRTIRAKGYNRRDIIILGAGDLAKNVIQKFQTLPWVGFKIKALFDDHLEKKNLLGIPVLGKLDQAVEYIKENSIDEVWFALPFKAADRINEILIKLSQTPIEIRFIPDIFGFKLINHDIFEIAGIPIISLSQSPISGINRLIKETEDKVLASLILIMLLPILLVIAIGVKLTSAGPVLFKQKRHGGDGKEIIVYKFRTMKIHNEKEGVVTQATKNDPRVTRFGAFLRRTSLDELPQFMNVLQGRMSIVGPRPHAVQHNQLYSQKIESYMQRHHVKPGITGWAQINGWRGETDTLDKMQKRVEYDMYYINNWSLFFDLKIIFLTIFKGIFGKNVY